MTIRVLNTVPGSSGLENSFPVGSGESPGVAQAYLSYAFHGAFLLTAGAMKRLAFFPPVEDRRYTKQR